MKIKAIIVDDDLSSRNLLKSYCSDFFSDKIDVLDVCECVDSAIISIKKNKPNLVFLDIDMPKKNGFDLIHHFSKIDFEVVFVTGHSNHYTKALECSALNYVMKPINPLNIKSIIDNFEAKNILNNSTIQLDILKQHLNKEQKSIIFPDNGGFKIAEISKIKYCETSNGNGKCKIMLNEEIMEISKSLSTLFQLLPHDMFLKISSSAIINKNFVKSFDSKNFNLIMKNDYRIKVSDKLYTKTSLMNALES